MGVLFDSKQYRNFRNPSVLQIIVCERLTTFKTSDFNKNKNTCLGRDLNPDFLLDESLALTTA